jgi:hypothetical protein
MTFAYLAAIIACGCLFFTRFARFDLGTAYFASVPGSFSEMLFVAEERKADLSAVAIVHSMRQVVALFLITLAFRYWFGIDTTQVPAIGEPQHCHGNPAHPHQPYRTACPGGLPRSARGAFLALTRAARLVVSDMESNSIRWNKGGNHDHQDHLQVARDVRLCGGCKHRRAGCGAD